MHIAFVACLFYFVRSACPNDLTVFLSSSLLCHYTFVIFPRVRI